ncbi:MAG TPA: DUF1573 domain-containing protein [Chthoniobacterales bacterium]
MSAPRGEINFMRSLLFVLAVSSTNAVAQLKWENPEQRVTARAVDQFVEVTYRFTNTGAYPVTIDEVQPSCGCTTVRLAKKEYVPGESGEMAARFDFAGRTGPQEKSILVVTKDTINQPVILKLLVTIPGAVKIEPEVVFWRVDEEPKPKVIRVTVTEGFPANIVSITSNNPEMRVGLKEVTPGKEVEVTVTPQNAGQPAKATLRIKTDYPVENRATHYAWAQVR